MPAKHKDSELHQELIFEFLREQGQIILIEFFKKIGKDKELVKKLDLTKYNNPDGTLRHEAKNRLNFILKQLKTNGRIETIEDENKGTIYQVIKKEQLGQEVTIIPKEKGKKDKSTEEKYVYWTSPSYVKENQRWEFYQKDERGQTQEIFFSESEEEIKDIHKQKVSQHIIAAMHNENKPKESNIKKSLKNKVQSADIKQSSSYIHEEALYEMMQMKIEGESTNVIFKTIKHKYNYSTIQIGTLYTKTLDFIKEKIKDLIEDTIQVHTERYEELYKWFNENGYSRWAIKVLERKEKMLGLSEEEISNKLLTNALGDKAIGTKRYIIGQLSEDERRELVVLVKLSMKKIQKVKKAPERVVIPKKQN